MSDLFEIRENPGTERKFKKAGVKVSHQEPGQGPEHDDPPWVFTKHKKGKSGAEITADLQRDTPNCQVCGAPSVTYRRTLAGKEQYRCGKHIDGTVPTEGYLVELLALYQIEAEEVE